MGCKSNQFESSIIVENLSTNAMVLVDKIEDANYFILNSCSVTHKSDNEALYLLRNAKHKNPQIKTILTGCVAQIEKEKLLNNEFIDFVVGNDEKLNLYKIIQNAQTFACSDIMKLDKFNYTKLNDMTKTRASLKIQDGCDSRCSYCIIPFARGKSRSANSEFIVEQINNFVSNGFKEVVLTGIHIGQWGKDFGLNLLDLLKIIEAKTCIKRYRLGSLNPTEINSDLLEFLSKSEKFCPHFHLSLQSACDKTLKSMNRFYKVEDYLKQIETINKMFDNAFLGSDIITGFAGESDEDFQITFENLKKSGLTQIHTFPYSLREGTVGAKSVNQVDEKTKEYRATLVKEISKQKYADFVNKNIGSIREILVEKHLDKFDNKLKGMSDNYLTVHLNSDDINLTNTIQKVRIAEFKDGKVYGEIV